MIRIIRPPETPKILAAAGKGAEQTVKDCSDYDACPNDYKSGKKKFDKRSYYNVKPVKDLLLKAHHCKCCYCEKRYRSRRALAVEHFRPKSAVKQGRHEKEMRPGYYWLTYNWDNLLLSCHDCNSDYKQILFPLADPRKRARSHHEVVDAEYPLFIDPVKQDPREHITFRYDSPTAVAKSKIGRLNIEELGLRRPALREDRLKELETLKTFQALVQSASKYPQDAELQKLAQKAQKYLIAAVLPQAEFSSMAQDFLSGS